VNAVPANTGVLFVSMPFAPLLTPSLGLSMLKAILARDGFASEILYLGIDFARRVGPMLYSRVAAGAPANHDLAGEWIFSSAVFRHAEAASAGYVRDVLRGEHPAHDKRSTNQAEFPEAFLDELQGLRTQVGAFLDACLERIVVRRPRLVGFTTVFQQNLASLALARRVRAELPGTVLLFGGANCEGVMGRELVRRFSFVDVVISGPGELVITELVKSVLEGRAPPDLPGVLTRQRVAADGSVPNAPPVGRLDDLPVPDFDDYFAQLREAEMDLPAQPRLLFETSRGCWWGEKHHCTFCGLNGQSMLHRSKSASRALAEVDELARRYPGLPVSVVDNILDMHYFKDFLPRLAERNAAPPAEPGGPKLELFYEVKANLSKEQLRLLWQAGVTQIQPGIESFSDPVLRLMRKGVRMLQNVQLLKWCKELGILPSWNILWGFPGEVPAEYQRMADLVPLLAHLPPPSSASPIRLDRFSPNFEAPAEHGFRNVRPYPSYYYIYALPDEAVRNLAYFFIYDRADAVDHRVYTASLARQITRWQEGYDRTDLFTVEVGPWLLLWDFRPVASAILTALSGLARLVYEECDEVRTVTHLRHAAAARFPSEGGVEDLLDALCTRGLMIRDEDRYLSLAVPTKAYTPGVAVLQRLKEALATVGKCDADGLMVVDCHHYNLSRSPTIHPAGPLGRTGRVDPVEPAPPARKGYYHG
jgi:ribosomal peptide maturation radical SAM protein 1